MANQAPDKRPHPASAAAQCAIVESAMEAMTSDQPPMYDVTIVCTTDDFQVRVWATKMELFEWW